MKINLKLLGLCEGLLATLLPAWVLTRGDTLERCGAVGVLMVALVLVSAAVQLSPLCMTQLRSVYHCSNLPARVEMYRRFSQVSLGMLLLSLSQGVVPSLASIGLAISASVLFRSIYFAECALEVMHRDIGHRCEHCAYPLHVSDRCSECGTLAPAVVRAH